IVYQSIFANHSLRINEDLVESSEAVNHVLDEWCRHPWARKYPPQPAFPEAPGMTDMLHSYATRPDLRTSIVEWFMGNTHVPFSKKQQFNVKGDIDRFSCMSFLNAFCRVLQHVGFGGLVVLIDEVESTMQLFTTVSRDAAYDNIRNLDENRYKIKKLYIAFGGTPEFFSDNERGVPSFPALNERIAHHWQNIRRSHRSPIVVLDPPQKHDYFVILRKMIAIYNEAYDSKIYISDDIIQKNLDSMVKTETTPRQVLREFVADLDQKAEQLSPS
ncbi:ATP-binding protein, partial [Candidatus Bathyarchaeota archaeon]|nr:ATP-binding protein [Candidatus Bathyarchaeota archaeon]